jgi:hypothetical protein
VDQALRGRCVGRAAGDGEGLDVAGPPEDVEAPQGGSAGLGQAMERMDAFEEEALSPEDMEALSDLMDMAETMEALKIDARPVNISKPTDAQIEALIRDFDAFLPP